MEGRRRIHFIQYSLYVYYNTFLQLKKIKLVNKKGDSMDFHLYSLILIFDYK